MSVSIEMTSTSRPEVPDDDIYYDDSGDNAMVMRPGSSTSRRRFRAWYLVPLVVVLVLLGSVIFSKKQSSSPASSKKSPEEKEGDDEDNEPFDPNAALTPWEQVGSTMFGVKGSSGIGYGYKLSLSAEANRLAISGPSEDRLGVVDVYVWDLPTGDWMLEDTVTPPPGARVEDSYTKLHNDVAMSGDAGRMALSGGEQVAAYYKAASAFGGGWQQMGDKIAPFVDDGTHFGKKVVLSENGKTLLVLGELEEKAVVQIYVENQQVTSTDVSYTWDLYEEIAMHKSAADMAVSADGRRIAVGMPTAPHPHFVAAIAGIIQVYERNDEIGKYDPLGVPIPGVADGEHFGGCVAMSDSGDIVVGGTSDGLGGIVRMWSLLQEPEQDPEWRQHGQTLYGEKFERFGSSVDLNKAGDIMAVGGIGWEGGDDEYLMGRAKIFKFNKVHNAWSGIGLVMSTNIGDSLGAAVDLSYDGFTVAVSSPQRVIGGEINVGAVEVFRRPA